MKEISRECLVALEVILVLIICLIGILIVVINLTSINSSNNNLPIPIVETGVMIKKLIIPEDIKCNLKHEFNGPGDGWISIRGWTMDGREIEKKLFLSYVNQTGVSMFNRTCEEIGCMATLKLDKEGKTLCVFPQFERI